MATFCMVVGCVAIWLLFGVVGTALFVFVTCYTEKENFWEGECVLFFFVLAGPLTAITALLHTVLLLLKMAAFRITMFDRIGNLGAKYGRKA